SAVSSPDRGRPGGLGGTAGGGRGRRRRGGGKGGKWLGGGGGGRVGQRQSRGPRWRAVGWGGGGRNGRQPRDGRDLRLAHGGRRKPRDPGAAVAHHREGARGDPAPDQRDDVGSHCVSARRDVSADGHARVHE